jgi:hypothetical protein
MKQVFSRAEITIPALEKSCRILRRSWGRPMRSIGLEKNASAFFDPVTLLRRTLISSSHLHGSDEPFRLRLRRWGTAKKA